MSSTNPGRQSPEPESQSGAQQNAPTATGSTNQQGNSSKSGVENLSSNPKHPLEDAAKEKVSKTVENNKA